MALIYFVKRALGFDNTADDTDEDIDNPFRVVTRPSDNTATATDADSTAPSDSAQAQNIENDMTDDSDTALPLVDASLPGCIFDSVIRLFNRTMPDFVRECLDTDSQRQYLFHAIESDVRRQMIRVVDEVRLNACKPSETKDAVSDNTLSENYRRQLRTAYNNFHREKEALERRIIDLEETLQSANDENARLQSEIAALNRRIRRSKNNTHMDDHLHPPLF